MNKTMKRILLASVAAVALGAVALAAIPTIASTMGNGMGYGMMGSGMMGSGMMGPGMMGSGMMGSGMMGGTTAAATAGGFDGKWFDGLKKELLITGDQETAWNEYVGTVRDSAENNVILHDTMHSQETAEQNAEDHFALMTSVHETFRQDAEEAQAAWNKLYATLDETQKSKTRILFSVSRGWGAMMGNGGTQGTESQ